MRGPGASRGPISRGKQDGPVYVGKLDVRRAPEENILRRKARLRNSCRIRPRCQSVQRPVTPRPALDELPTACARVKDSPVRKALVEKARGKALARKKS